MAVADRLRYHWERGQLHRAIAFRLRHPRGLSPPVLASEPRLVKRQPSHSVRRLNTLLAACGESTSYLEVGVSWGQTFEAIDAGRRVGVDPSPRFDIAQLPANAQFHHVPSDDYFAMRDNQLFDVIFVDGLHEWRQAYRDLINGLQRLRPGGALLLDDTVPSDEVSAMPDLETSTNLRRALGLPGDHWHGDVWRVVAVLDAEHPELRWATIVGSGNAQTLVWPGTSTTASMSSSDLSWVDDRSFSVEFADGVPGFLHPMTEDDAIALWRDTRAGGDAT